MGAIDEGEDTKEREREGDRRRERVRGWRRLQETSAERDMETF